MSRTHYLREDGRKDEEEEISSYWKK